MSIKQNKLTRPNALSPVATLADTMQERGSNYGEFSDIADLSQKIEELVMSADGRSNLPLNNATKECMKMIIHKIARVAVGDASYKDNWHDIQGYAKLAEDRSDD